MEPKKNKKHGLIEIIVGIFFLAFFPYRIVRYFIDPDSIVFGYIYFSITIIGIVFLIIGLVKMLKNKKRIASADTPKLIKKQNPKWLILALLLVSIGLFLVFYSQSSCKGVPSPSFCGVEYLLLMIPFVGVGVFILFIYFIKKFTKNK